MSFRISLVTEDPSKGRHVCRRNPVMNSDQRNSSTTSLVGTLSRFVLDL